MLNSLTKYESTAYAMLRVMAGFTYSLHGLQKLVGIFADHTVPLFSQLWYAGVIESVAGILILLGLKAGLAAFIASGEMAVAYFQVHWQFRMDENFFPLVNHGDLPVLYCFIFFYVACKGSGRFSIDYGH